MHRYAPLLIALVCALTITPRAAASEPSDVVSIDFGAVPAGTSVVGLGKVHPWLEIHESGGNDVIAVQDSANPVAYGGTWVDPSGNWWDVANRCIGTGGFADIGSGTYSYTTKNHEYTFSFAPGITVSQFSLKMVDWSDFMPYGACPDNTCGVVMTAFDANGSVVATDQLTFTVTARFTGLSRDTLEYGNTRTAGDACLAPDGHPGRATFEVTGPGIARVTLAFMNQASKDPHVALTGLGFTVERVVVDVDVDVKPGSFPNVVNPGSNGTTVAAILGADGFDATTVDPLTVTLAEAPVQLKKNGSPMASHEDVNGDGLLDLVMHFQTSLLPQASGDVELTGLTFGGQSVRGVDSISVAGA
jgi:hypothetical protein